MAGLSLFAGPMDGTWVRPWSVALAFVGHSADYCRTKRRRRLPVGGSRPRMRAVSGVARTASLAAGRPGVGFVALREQEQADEHRSAAAAFEAAIDQLAHVALGCADLVQRHQ